jgi:hypothetical protein
MHDREEHLFDQAFTDRAWGEMEKLLDKEMPVQSKGHRFLWLWALGLVILGGLGWLFGPTSNVIRAEELLSLPLADQTDSRSNLSANMESTVTIPSTDTFEEKIAHQNSSQNVIPNENKLTRKPEDASINYQEAKPQSGDVNLVEEITSEFILSTASTSKEEPLVSSHELLPSVEDQVESDIFLKEQERSSLAVAALPFLQKESKELSWPLRKTPESIEFKSKVRPQRSNWNWGVQAFALGTDVFDLNGGAIGVWGQRPHFFTPRLSLSLGVQYELINLQPSSISIPSNVQLDASTESSDPTTSFPPNRQMDTVTAQQAAAHLNLRVRQFQLPLSLHWSFGRKWSAFGGAQLSYRNVLIREPAENDQSLAFSGSDPQTGLYSELVKLDPGATFPANNLNRWDIGTHLGIAYRLSNRMEAMMSYEHGFKNLFKDLDLQAYDRKWTLGLSYRFGR